MAWQPDYCTSSDLLEFCKATEDGNIPSSGQSARAAMAVTAASRSIDQSTNRQFGKVNAPETRHYTAKFDHTIRRWTVRIDDLHSSLSLEVRAVSDSFDEELTDYRMFPFNSEPEGRPYTDIWLNQYGTVPISREDGLIQVTGNFGWASVPVAIKNATLIQANRWINRQDSPYGVFGIDSLQGRIFYKVDADVESIIRPYRRVWAVGG